MQVLRIKIGLIYALLGTVLSSSPLHAQPDDDAVKKQREEHRHEMQRLAQSVAVFEKIRTERTESKQLREPLMRYSDIAREIYDSTLWAWGERGRPVALMKVEYYPQAPGGPHWLYGVVSLSPHRITAERSEGWQWTAEKAGLELQSLSDAPAPAETVPERLRQMKQLVRRFAAYQITAGSDKLRLDLRLLSQPICRYSDPQAGLDDGAIFAFANSTNPEVLVVIESHREGSSPATWRYGLARLCGGEAYASLDGKENWSQPPAPVPSALDTYVNVVVPVREKEE